MATLEQDTVYYRYNHPTGFIFGAGVEAPREEDGWVLAPEDIGEPPARTYECTTLEAFQNLLDSERAAAATHARALAEARQQLQASEGHRLVLIGEIQRLNTLLEAQEQEEGA